jgi:hypothetical protein
MKYACTHAMIGRKPRKNKEDEFKTFFVKLFNCSGDPLTSGEFPSHEFDFANIEHVDIQAPSFHYYPEGNDIVFKQITGVEITQQQQQIVFKVIK